MKKCIKRGLIAIAPLALSIIISKLAVSRLISRLVKPFNPLLSLRPASWRDHENSFCSSIIVTIL